MLLFYIAFSLKPQGPDMQVRTFTRLLTLLTIVSLFPVSAQAAHLIGTSINYECLNNCTTRIYVKVYRECNATVLINNNVSIQVNSGSCTPPVAASPLSVQTLNQFTPVCPNFSNACVSTFASLPGVEEWSAYRDYDICGAAAGCTFDLYWTECCRNGSITSIVSPNTQEFWISSTLNTGLAACNSSPQWNELPVTYICGQSQTLSDLGAWDADGDSLVYRFDTCLTSGPGAPVVYNSGYSDSRPLGPNWETDLNPNTGLLSISPNPGGVVTGVVCIFIDEYRNGQLIGSYERDIQITTISCPAGNTAPSLSGISNLNGNSAVSQSGDSIFVCAGNGFSFTVSASDPDQDPLLLSWGKDIPGATFHAAGNPGINDTIYGQTPAATFSWTPTAPGIYSVLFWVNDDECPYPFFDLDTVTVVVSGNCGAAQAVPLACRDVAFSAQATGGTGNYTYQWSGQGGLNGSLDSLIHRYPGGGSYAWQVIISDGASLNDTIQGIVTIPGPVYTPLIASSGNIDPCGAGAATLASGGYASYLWSNGSTNAIISTSTPGTYSLTVSDNNGCQFYDSLSLGLTPPAISGYVSASNAAPLANQRVYLIKYDSIVGSLQAVDTSITDASGYYQFCNVSDSLVFVKAAPDSLSYPTEMPTYADTALFWNQAMSFSAFSTPYQVNFSTRFGQNPGGSGFLGGLISQGANKSSGIGDPLPGLPVFLIDDANETVMGYTATDNSGYFSFSNLPFGNFRVIVDVPGVNTVQVPVVSVNAASPNRDSLDFRLHSSYLEWVIATGEKGLEEQDFSFTVAPNPFQGQTQIRLKINRPQEVCVEIFNIQGQKIARLHQGKLEAGVHSFQFGKKGQKAASGIHFVKVTAGRHHRHLKIISLGQ